MNYFDLNGLVKSCSIEIGGGNGYCCNKCHKLYHIKPDICHNVIVSKVLNNDRFIELIQQLSGVDIKPEMIINYINNQDSIPDEIGRIFKEENECLTIEESAFGKYDNFMEMVTYRYPEVYDKIEIGCGCDNFTYEQRRGQEIDRFDT